MCFNGTFPFWAQSETELCSSAGVSLMNAALVEKEAAALQVAAAGNKSSPPGFKEAWSKLIKGASGSTDSSIICMRRFGSLKIL